MKSKNEPVVYIIEDDSDLRHSLDSLLRSIGLSTRLFASTAEFLQLDRLESVSSCLVVDVRLPGQSGLDFQDQLVTRGVTIPIVFMTGYGDIPMTVRAMKAGAIDFLTKPFREQDLVEAVAAALEVDKKNREESALQNTLSDRYHTLTAREKEVMALATAGLMNKQIAGKLDISIVTVKIHRGSAMRKMGARNLAQLVVMAEQMNIHESSIVA